MAEGSETPGNEPPEGGDLDFLAARRARRAELSDPALVRRAEVAEATVRTLETHMASLQARLRELEEEQRRTAEQLGEREQEMRRVKQREYAEQQLRVEAEESRERLGREHRAEVDRLSRRLAGGERHARELAEQLESARRELAETEQTAAAERAQLRRTQEELVGREADIGHRELALDRTRAEVERRLGEARAFERQAQGLLTRAEEDSRQLATRLVELEGRAGELQQGLESERAARERSEQSLALAQRSYARLESLVGELKLTALHLREAVEREGRARGPVSAPPPAAAAPVVPEEDALRRAEMAEALAAAVERLRARVAAVGELEAEPPVRPAEPQAAPLDQPLAVDDPPAVAAPVPAAPPGVEAEPAGPVTDVTPEVGRVAQGDRADPVEPEPDTAEMTNFRPRIISPPGAAQPWLAPAIRRIAARRDAKLAGELIVELLPAQCLALEDTLTYRLQITELGLFEVRLHDGHASVKRVASEESRDAGSSEKPAFVLEGPAAAFSELAAGGAGRRLAGIRVSGSRRRARRLLRARRPPVALPDLVSAGMRIWPGLLLLALTEAIDPHWTVGSSFDVAFAIEGSEGSETVIYVRVRDGEPVGVTRVRGERPRAVAHLNESSFLRVLAGLPLPAGEQVLIEGDAGPLQQLIGWADRAQGRGIPG